MAWHDGKLLCLFEGGEPHVAKLPNLETVGPYTYDGKLKHPFTAHPKIDAATGEMLFFGYSALSPFVQYSIADAQGDLVRTVPVELRRPTMMHDFAVTEKHAIFMDLPVVFDLSRAGAGEPVFGYRPELGSRFGVLPRNGQGEIRWFDSPACFVFHTLNAWEDGDEVVLAACRMSEFPAAVAIGQGKPSSGSASPLDISTQLYEWRFNLQTGQTPRRAARRPPAPTFRGSTTPCWVARRSTVMPCRWKWRDSSSTTCLRERATATISAPAASAARECLSRAPRANPRTTAGC